MRLLLALAPAAAQDGRPLTRFDATTGPPAPGGGPTTTAAWPTGPSCVLRTEPGGGDKRQVIAFTDFTLEAAEAELGVTLRPGVVFPHLPDAAPPPWLTDALARGMQLALVSEKARSEFIVAPIMLAVRELSGGRVSILSGQRLDVDPARRLSGECDFILALSEPLPRLRAPLMTIVEARKNDIEAGLGQGIAQMVAAQVFNARVGHAGPVFGCVTTGEDWQFLRLDGADVVIDTARRYINAVGSVLAALLASVGQPDPV